MGLFFIIFFVAVAMGSAAALALVQNARDADEAWEDAIKKKQNRDIK